MTTTRGKRVALALAAGLVVLACQLVPPFLYNTYGVGVAIVTAFVILVPLERAMTGLIGPRGGLLVGVTTLALVPAAWIIAEWEIQRELHVWVGSSDVEDFFVFLTFAVGGPVGVALATWLAGTGSTKKRVNVLRGILGGSLLLVALFLVASAVRASRAQTPLNHTADVVVAGVGLALAVVQGVLALRTQREYERLAAGRGGRHKGDGWVELDEPTAPVHRPELAASPEGPVVVLGAAQRTGGGYRDGGVAQPLTVTLGTADQIRARGLDRAASCLALGSAVVLIAALKLLAGGRFGFDVMMGTKTPTMHR